MSEVLYLLRVGVMMESPPHHFPHLTFKDQIPWLVLEKTSLWPDLQIGHVAENVFIALTDQD